MESAYEFDGLFEEEGSLPSFGESHSWSRQRGKHELCLGLYASMYPQQKNYVGTFFVPLEFPEKTDLIIAKFPSLGFAELFDCIAAASGLRNIERIVLLEYLAQVS